MPIRINSAQQVNGMITRTLSADLLKKERKTAVELNNYEVLDLIARYRLTGDVHYRNRIIEGVTKYIFFCASKEWYEGLILSDLIQEGVFGAMQGIEKYEEVKNTRPIKWLMYYAIREMRIYKENVRHIIRYARNPMRCGQNFDEVMEQSLRQYEEMNVPVDVAFAGRMRSKKELLGGMEYRNKPLQLNEEQQDISDHLPDHDERIESLKELCKKKLSTLECVLVFAKYGIAGDFKLVCQQWQLSKGSAEHVVKDAIFKIKKYHNIAALSV